MGKTSRFSDDDDDRNPEWRQRVTLSDVSTLILTESSPLITQHVVGLLNVEPVLGIHCFCSSELSTVCLSVAPASVAGPHTHTMQSVRSFYLSVVLGGRSTVQTAFRLT